MEILTQPDFDQPREGQRGGTMASLQTPTMQKSVSQFKTKTGDWKKSDDLLGLL